MVAPLFDSRKTLTRTEAREVYDGFARKGHIGGQDAGGGYGGPAVQALLTMAAFANAGSVLEFGCGGAKLAEAALTEHRELEWRAVDMSCAQLENARARMSRFGTRFSCELLEEGDPAAVTVSEPVDRFVSTYVLDLLNEGDMMGVIDAAERCLDPHRGILLLAGITWGYQGEAATVRTFLMTMLWEVLYKIRPRTVGGCRPQLLGPYLEERGWRIVSIERTSPDGFPWMASEVLSARPPLACASGVGSSQRETERGFGL